MFIQGENRGYDDGVSGVHADRIHILHPADGNCPVIRIPHDLKFNFLITFDALFNQHLMNGGETEGIDADLLKFLLIVCKSASRASEGKCRAQYNGIADFLGGPFCMLQIIGDLGGNDRLPDGLAHLLEEFAVFGALNALAACAQKLNSALVQNAFALQLHCKVQACLTADAGDDRIRPFVTQDFSHVVKRQRFHVDFVGDRGVCHDRGRVGVDQHNLVALLLERQAGLCACIVKLRRLTDHNRSRADDKHFFNVCSFCHFQFSS